MLNQRLNKYLPAKIARNWVKLKLLHIYSPIQADTLRYKLNETRVNRDGKNILQTVHVLTLLFQIHTLWSETTANSERSLLYFSDFNSPQWTSFELKYFGQPIGKYISRNDVILWHTHVALLATRSELFRRHVVVLASVSSVKIIYGVGSGVGLIFNKIHQEIASKLQN